MSHLQVHAAMGNDDRQVLINTKDFEKNAVRLLTLFTCALQTACTPEIKLTFNTDTPKGDELGYYVTTILPRLNKFCEAVDVELTKYRLDLFNVVESGFNRHLRQVHVS